MRGNRTLVIFAVVLIVVALIAGAGYLYLQSLGGDEPEPTEEVVEVQEPEVIDIVVAAQNIPRGMRISEEDLAIELRAWPLEYLPPQYYTSLAEVDGKFARMDIPLGIPLMPDMIAGPGGGRLAPPGSAAALFEPDDRVAYAIPMDTQGAVAWAIRPGDRVDVLAALKMVAVSSEAATEGINQFTYLEENGLPSQTSPFGRFEILPNGRWAAIYPIDATSNLRPALMVQMTVQDAIVWNIGVWEEEIEEITPAQQPGDDGGGVPVGGAPAAEPTPPPVPEQYQDIEPVTLLVTRQDALVLKYLLETGADLDLALRPAGFTGEVLQTQPILFRFILDRYNLQPSLPEEPVGPAPVRTEPLELLPIQTPPPEE